MSLLYIDSSFLLALLFAEPHAADYAAIWEKAASRISSILLRVECSVVLHRVRALPEVWGWLEELLGTVNLRAIDERITGRIRADADYGALRSLDAVHLATACESLEAAPSEVTMACLDLRLRKAALSRGLPLLPSRLGSGESIR